MRFKLFFLSTLVLAFTLGQFTQPLMTHAISPATTTAAAQSVAVGQIGGTWTYAQVVSASDEVAGIINSNRKRLVQAKTFIDVADNELGGLAAAYGAVGTAIDAAVTAAPTNQAYLMLDAQWDELVSEFQALKAESAAQKAALEAL